MVRPFREHGAPGGQGKANAFSDFIEMGANARQTGFTTRLRGRILPTVMFVFRRAWCRETGSPRSREASGSNPWSPAKSNLQILSHNRVLIRSRMRANGKCSAVKLGRAGRLKAGAKRKERFQSPGGTRTQATMANRVKGSTGSFNARWRREPGGGNTDRPEADNLRGSAEKSRP